MFANSKRFVDPLHAVEPDEHGDTPCYETETEKQSAKGEAICDHHDAIQRSLDLRILNWRCRGVLSWGRCYFWDVKKNLLAVLDFYRRNTSLKLSAEGHLFSFRILGNFQLVLNNLELTNIRRAK